MLELTNVALRYGKHLALHGVGISIAPAETVVVLGANGAGKSSLLKVLGGLVRPEPGADLTFETKILGRPAHDFPELGIALVPEGRGIFGDLTVAENLQLGAHPPMRVRTKSVSAISSSTFSRALQNAKARSPAPCPAVNSKWSPSAAPS